LYPKEGWWDYNRKYSKLSFQPETPKIEKPGIFSTTRYTNNPFGLENAF
jgi:hypothetical protein